MECIRGESKLNIKKLNRTLKLNNMKRILTVLAIITLVSCSERGEIHEQPADFIVIHGKTYKLMRIVPSDGANAIWIMYPKDSSDAMPTIINYQTKQGKATVNQAVIKID